MHVCMYVAPSKSIVDAWYENVGYRYLGGDPIALQCSVQINPKQCKHAAGLASGIQILLEID